MRRALLCRRRRERPSMRPFADPVRYGRRLQRVTARVRDRREMEVQRLVHQGLVPGQALSLHRTSSFVACKMTAATCFTMSDKAFRFRSELRALRESAFLARSATKSCGNVGSWGYVPAHTGSSLRRCDGRPSLRGLAERSLFGRRRGIQARRFLRSPPWRNRMGARPGNRRSGPRSREQGHLRTIVSMRVTQLCQRGLRAAVGVRQRGRLRP